MVLIWIVESFWAVIAALYLACLISDEVIRLFGDVYPELIKNKEFVTVEMAKEESKFRNTIEQGLKEFEKLINGFRIAFEKTGQHIGQISGKQAFKLYDTYGFPLEMTQELANENGLSVDVNGFEAAFKAHQDMSRVGAEHKFKGGLADTSEMSAKYHTATHLLHAALRKVLGQHAEQRGSNITAERIRLDFSHPQKVTPEELQQVEDLVSQKIQEGLNMVKREMPKASTVAKMARDSHFSLETVICALTKSKLNWEEYGSSFLAYFPKTSCARS